MNNNTNNAPRMDFDGVKRKFETALANGGDYSPELIDLSTAIAYSVINKCLDPQRKTATEHETISNNGHNPALLEVKRGIAFDRRMLDNTAAAADKATRTTYNADGDMVTEIADRDAETALAALIGETLSDGIDLVQTAACALLEQAADHADPAAPWLDTPYTVRRISRRVYIKDEDTAAWRDEETTPIQEVFKEVRRAVMNSRAVQTDPRNGYTYIEDYAKDDCGGLEVIYHRLQKWADIGGFNHDGHYTADRQSMVDYYDILNRLELTGRQAVVMRYRMQGNGYKAIASHLGVTPRAVAKTVELVRKKAAEIGYTPSMWLEMTGRDIDRPAKQDTAPATRKPATRKPATATHTATRKGIEQAIADAYGVNRYELHI